MDQKINITSLASEKEIQNRNNLARLHSLNPLPDSEKISQSGLFLKRQELSKILFFNELYQNILEVNGVIIEFGTRWGQNLVTLSNLRGIYEPYNYGRRIIGFDTFDGFKNANDKDGDHEIIRDGNFSVSEKYENYLETLIDAHEQESPLNHIKKNLIIKGDASVELKRYLNHNPQTIIALAWFDFDLYEPTRKCLELIKPYLVKGAILGFDELNDPKFPGETLALTEFLNINQVALKRNRFSALQSYFVYGH